MVRIPANSKLNACVNNVLRIWNDTKEQKLTQLIFCDMSTPKGDGSFNVYDDIRTKLLNAGVPEQEIEFIHNADTENKKAELFSKPFAYLIASVRLPGFGDYPLAISRHTYIDVSWEKSGLFQIRKNIRIPSGILHQIFPEDKHFHMIAAETVYCHSCGKIGKLS